MKWCLTVVLVCTSLVNNDADHFYVLDYHLNTFDGEISKKIFEFLNLYILIGLFVVLNCKVV